MAETAQSIVSDALQELTVSASEQPIEASEFQTGIRYLNRMMAEFDSRGIALGFTEVSKPDDAITVAAGAINGMIFNLAMKLAPTFDVSITAGLAQSAKDGFQAMLDLAVVIRPTKLSCILPVGSGNEGHNHGHHDRFFPCPDPAISTEDNGNILLETDT